MGVGALAPGRVCTEFPKDKEFGAFEMLEKIGFSLKPRRCEERLLTKIVYQPMLTHSACASCECVCDFGKIVAQGVVCLPTAEHA
jgi:hypothetical protein